MAQKTCPDFAYIGAAWVGRPSRSSSPPTSIAEHVKGAIGRKEYRMAPLPDGLQSKPVSQSQMAPSLDMSSFELTMPTSANELPPLVDTISRGKQCGKTVLPDSEVWKGMSWADILKAHNDEFNPSGAVKNKRLAETPAEELPVSKIAACGRSFVLSSCDSSEASDDDNLDGDHAGARLAVPQSRHGKVPTAGSDCV